MSARVAAMLLALAALGGPARAGEAGFQELGGDLGVRVERVVKWAGEMRVRADFLHNLDLDRGPTPSGQLLFPVPLGDPKGQTLTHFDSRFRTDLTFVAPFGGVAAKLRLDVFDNLALGSRPDGPPSAATGQSPPPVSFQVKRAWAEALTPFGVLAAGRMGSHWGLGMLTHGGDCFGCDSGDAADRIAFATPLVGHVWATSFDFTAIGPTVQRVSAAGVVDVEPADNVYTYTFAVLRYHDDLARARRRAAGKTTVEYGAYLSHRWQDVDVPATYAADVAPSALTRQQVVPRGFTATAVDGWLRITHPWFVVEAEAAGLFAGYEQASVVPGVLLAQEVDGTQWGLALESRIGPADAVLTGGLDLGVASGDPAFGFGVRQALGATPPQRGDLDGPQAALPHDASYDNFRFHPDYRIDRILFREIVGTVTDAVYVRPHGRVHVREFLGGELIADLAVVASWTLNATSAPGLDTALGVEIDPSLSYRTEDGFRLDLDYAVLLPLAGLDNLELGLAAKPAQLVRLTLGFLF